MQASKRRITLSAIEKEQFLIEISEGKQVNNLCVEYGITPYHFGKMLKFEPQFAMELDLAREMGAWVEVDSLKSITENVLDATDASCARVESENIKWRASKNHRQRYGEKIEMAITNHIDLSKVFAAANSRVVPMLDPTTLQIDVTPAISDTYEDDSTGLEPVANQVAAPKKATTFDDLL